MKARQQWEYLARSFSAFMVNVPLETDMNKLGNDGWELSCIVPWNNSSVMVFKRPVTIEDKVDA